MLVMISFEFLREKGIMLVIILFEFVRDGGVGDINV